MWVGQTPAPPFPFDGDLTIYELSKSSVCNAKRKILNQQSYIDPSTHNLFMKKKVIFLVIGLIIFATVGIAGCTSKSTSTTSVSTPALTTSVSTPAPTTSVSTPAPTLKPDKTTMGERNAAKKALEYLRFTSFSRDGLIDQLEFEGFTRQEAEYGVDQSGANWNEQAALKAKEYLKFTSFSRSGLIDQLEFEGFTSQQAEYGVDQSGANWNEQAALKAKEYLKFTSFSRSGLIDQLEFEGFTSQQAEYGVQAVGY